MTRPTKHTRILTFPGLLSLENARLNNLSEEYRGRRHDLVLDYSENHWLGPTKLFRQDGRVFEQGSGEYHPRRLRFAGLRWLKRTGLYTNLETIPPDHLARTLRGALYCSPPGEKMFFLLFNGSIEPASLTLSAQKVVTEERPGSAEPFMVMRDWATPPTLWPGLVPRRPHLYQRFGGDPITIRLGQRLFHHRLFVGGIEIQPEYRPEVDVVLNLGESPSRWVKDDLVVEPDLWVEQGEGNVGMDAAAITTLAQWVVAHLRDGRRVLVHCVAGFNRSVTICCAVLMQLEGLTAETALARARQTHPWSRPDAYHWLALRWLARPRLDSVH